MQLQCYAIDEYFIKKNMTNITLILKKGALSYKLCKS